MLDQHSLPFPIYIHFFGSAKALEGTWFAGSEEQKLPNCFLSFHVFTLQLLPKVSAKGVVLAGGLHPDIAPKYFRFVLCILARRLHC